MPTITPTDTKQPDNSTRQQFEQATRTHNALDRQRRDQEFLEKAKARAKQAGLPAFDRPNQRQRTIEGRVAAASMAEQAAPTELDINGIHYVIDSNVDINKAIFGFYGIEFTRDLANQSGFAPQGARVEFKATGGTNPFVVDGNKITVDTTSVPWLQLDAINQAEMSGAQLFRIMQAQLAGMTADTGIPQPEWVKRGSGQNLGEIAVRGRVLQKSGIQIAIEDALDIAGAAQLPPPLQTLEATSVWQNLTFAQHRTYAKYASLGIAFAKGFDTGNAKVREAIDYFRGITQSNVDVRVQSIIADPFYSNFANLVDAFIRNTRDANPTATTIPTVSSTPTARPSETLPAITATPSTTPSRTPSPSPTITESPTPTRTPETQQFYTQRRSVDGVEVRANAVVSTQALNIAENNLHLLTDHEPTSRSRMVANQFGGYVIIGRNQKLTDLPEWASFRGQYVNPNEPDPSKRILWDDIRGATYPSPGGTTAIAEEILLNNQAFMCHEQSHPRQIFGFTADQRQLWTEIFNNARNRNIFPGTYGMQNEGEYWAENSRLWCGSSPGFTLNDLQLQDPDSYNFLITRLGTPPVASAAFEFPHDGERVTVYARDGKVSQITAIPA